VNILVNVFVALVFNLRLFLNHQFYFYKVVRFITNEHTYMLHWLLNC